MRSKRFFFAIALILIGPLLNTNLAAAYNEIWIAPAGHEATKEVGNWAVTPNGDTNFSFGVPDNLQAFSKAQVVVIGKKTEFITYDLDLSASKDGISEDARTQSIHNLSANITEDQITEIDVTSIIQNAEPFSNSRRCIARDLSQWQREEFWAINPLV